MRPLMMLTLLLACGPTTTSIGQDSAENAPPSPDTADDEIPGTEAAVGFGCVPAANEASVDEGETAIVQFACTGSFAAEGWRLIDGPIDADFDETTGRLTWTTDLASAGGWAVHVQAIAGAASEDGLSTVWVADAWDARGNSPVDPLTYTHEYGLPVVHLEVPRNIDAWSKVAGTFTYRGEAHTIAAQIRGAASSYYPKNSYNIDFLPQDEFRDEELGFPQRHNIVLTTLFDDNAYFRQKLCYDMWNLLDGTFRIETRFVVVYLNGAYWGLYLLGDHIDGEWYEDYGYPEDGNLYKSVDHAANFYATYGGWKSSWHQGYEKKEGLPEDDFSDLDSLVELVATADDATFEAEIAQRIDLEQVYDWWALVVFAEADDSGGKNAYFYNVPAQPGFHFAPWDFNHALGQTWQTDREPATYDYDFTSANGLFKRLLASRTFGPDMSDRFREARAGVLAPEALTALIDSYIADIDPSARRDWSKWEAEYRSYGGWSWRSNWTDYTGEVQYVRDWVGERWAFIERWDP